MAFSPDDKHIIVNYHYVRNPSPDWGGIHPCPISEFEKQVKFLSENYKFVSVPEFYEAAKAGDVQKKCAITFDDGLRDQYENAVPILKKYGATATFFIITSTLEGKVPSAHKIHLLTSRIPVEKLLRMFDPRIPLDRRITDRRPNDSIASANFKETMIAAPEDRRNEFLARAIEELKIDEREFSREFFMKEAEIKNLLAEGFYPESHTHHHASLENYGLDFFRKDFAKSNEILASITARNPLVMSYPHGRSNAETHAALAEYGFKYAVTIEPRGLRADDNPFMIPRYDTNHLRDYLNKLM